MYKITRTFLFLIFLFTLAAPVSAQDAEYRVRTNRVFGYGNGSDARGSYALTIYGNQDNIQSVTYLLDGKEMASLTEPPFRFGFQTSSYPDGPHAITAVVNTKDNRKVTTPEVHINFLSAAQESQGMTRILFPLLGVLFVLMLVGVGVQFYMTRRDQSFRTPGAKRSYGLKGGAICPRCGRAYAIHFFSINLIGGVLDRCDYCGKWAFVRARSRAELDAAVQSEITAAQDSETSLPAVDAETDEEHLRKMMDESKYSE